MKFILLIPLLLLAGCGVKMVQDHTLAKVNKMVYHFGDSSVPPEYHRSYTITVTENDARIVVDSYGNILNESTVAVSSSGFKAILDVIKKSGIGNRSRRGDDGCVGGTMESMNLFVGQSEVFSGSVYYCGGEDYGDLCGNIENVSKKMKGLFPNFSILVE